MSKASITHRSLEGFDSFAGERWIYPNNMPVRGYQKTAVEMALFKNAMIVLPTGFGKTFIAAVVMYNFYRWYPTGKIIFVAPTRPLVAQQIQECRKISGIPSSDCFELTGSINSDKRTQIWISKRVFFATPQVIENDLDSSILPAKQVKCIVIDEAHRAQGGYAYTNIVAKLHQRNPNSFRVLALSATPGSDIQKVQQVMQNLHISDVMFRTEESIDLCQYKNQKCVKAWTVDLVGKHKEFVDVFIKITDPIFKTLYRAGLTFSGDSIEKVAKFTLLKAMKDVGSTMSGKSKGKLSFQCNAAMSLSHHFQLLVIYGIRVFYSSLMRSMKESRSTIRVALAGSPDFDRMLNEMRNLFGEDIEPDASKEAKADLFLGHPKLRVVKDLLVKHFTGNTEKPETRAMVFSKFRESVSDIVQTLRSVEGLKPAAFVGQASSRNGEVGMKQKDQIQLIEDFKKGKFNVLVATCVAEEGLDIGEVDLIICYDTSASPISNTQRRGRTGRKRSGDVHTILTKDYEEKRLKNAGNSKRQVEDQLYKRENYMMHRYRDAPRMVPDGIVPLCLEQKIFPINDDVSEKKETKSKVRKRTIKDLIQKDTAKCKTNKKKCIDEDEEDLSKMDKKKSKSFSFANSLLESDDEYDTIDLGPKSTSTLDPEAKSPDELDSSYYATQSSSATKISEIRTDDDDLPSNSGYETEIKSSGELLPDSDIEWEDDLEFNCV